MKTDKKLQDIEDNKDDVGLWNEFLRTAQPGGSEIAWFNGAWLTCETFMYRKIYEAFALR